MAAICALEKGLLYVIFGSIIPFETICDNWGAMDDAMVEQMVRRYGNAAALHANETATVLDAIGDADGAARWRRIRDLILALPRTPPGEQFGSDVGPA